MNKRKISLPELLAPGGSPEAVAAAVSAGADGIYFGAKQFSARARAKNLDAGETREALSLCRAHGVRAYAAVNTRVRDSETDAALRVAEELLTLGADALIVADIGLAAAIRHRFPEIPLHASTQITGTTAEDAKVLSEAGFCRMVCPRELTLPEIARLTEASPIGIEAFIHGAHCVSVSGQCSLSYVMGGRSGNRGDCAGPCRLPFSGGFCEKKGTAYDLSLKDMCLASHIRALTDAGVESFKIEGRLKGPEYTYGVVSVYRRLLDEGRDATPEDVAELREIFSRDGFSDGYLRGRYTKMLGVRGDSHLTAGGTVPPPRKVPLTGELCLTAGERAKLTLTSPRKTVTVTGDLLSPATGNPPGEESLARSVSKLGSTPFVMERCTVIHDGVCGISAASLNALRRAGTELLLAPTPVTKCDGAAEDMPAAAMPTSVVRCAILSEVSQLTPAVREYFREIYLPLYDFLESPQEPAVGVSLPDVMYDADEEAVRRALRIAGETGSPVLAHGMGELAMSVAAGCTTHASHRFVVYNSLSAAALRGFGAASVTLSTEVTVKAAEDASKLSPIAAVTGGRMPLMLCRRCPLSDGGEGCPKNRAGGYDGGVKDTICRGTLRDRTGAVLPAVGDRMCMTTIYNSVPTACDMDDGELLALGIGRTYYIFSTESPSAADRTVELLRRGELPEKYRKAK